MVWGIISSPLRLADVHHRGFNNVCSEGCWNGHDYQLQTGNKHRSPVWKLGVLSAHSSLLAFEVFNLFSHQTKYIWIYSIIFSTAQTQTHIHRVGSLDYYSVMNQFQTFYQLDAHPEQANLFLLNNLSCESTSHIHANTASTKHSRLSLFIRQKWNWSKAYSLSHT